MKLHPCMPAASLIAALHLFPAHAGLAGDAPIKKDKLRIFFCLGQSNMVGLADVRTAWYPTQPQYVPPREACVAKSRHFDWNFYWSGARYYEGPRNAELAGLVDAREKSRMKWRQRVMGTDGIEWDEPAWGPKPDPMGGRAVMYAFLDEKAEQEGIYKPIAEIRDSPGKKEAPLMSQRAGSEKGFHYHGSAKFFLPNGDALARSLAGLMAK